MLICIYQNIFSGFYDIQLSCSERRKRSLHKIDEESQITRI